jgi:DNA-binding transcriptional MerR regulator
MRIYAIGEVADMLEVKPHVIRYWEQEIPFLAPRKGLSGRRAYTAREVRLLFRVKHLVHENRYTIEGARQRLWAEAEADPPELQILVAEIRDELVEAWTRLRRLRGDASPPPPDVPMI